MSAPTPYRPGPELAAAISTYKQAARDMAFDEVIMINGYDAARLIATLREYQRVAASIDDACTTATHLNHGPDAAGRRCAVRLLLEKFDDHHTPLIPTPAPHPVVP